MIQMSWSNKIDLGNWVETITYGEPVRTIAWTTVWANKKGVRQSEFYMANNAGLKPELMFEVHSEEYAGQEMVRFPSTTGDIYTIIRTYEKNMKTEIVCAARVGDLNG